VSLFIPSGAIITVTVGEFSIDLQPTASTAFDKVGYSNPVQKIPLVFGGVLFQGQSSAYTSSAGFSIAGLCAMSAAKSLSSKLLDNNSALIPAQVMVLSEVYKVLITEVSYKKALQDSINRVDIAIKGYSIPELI